MHSSGSSIPKSSSRLMISVLRMAEEVEVDILARISRRLLLVVHDREEDGGAP
jgi:hypothetical protein